MSQLLPYKCDDTLSKETEAKVSLKYRDAAYNINCSVVNQNIQTDQTLIYRGALYIKNQVISTISQSRRSLKCFILPCHDPDHGEAIGIKFYPSKLFKHPLRSKTINFCFSGEMSQKNN
ncbi:DUF4278 domain-containing protein [Nostoc sp. PCC 7524]|uniref:DUF4278 domain-containing protein n=1 Tax=Nostoc sp. (strain ATCC 29411 / PCC 7524) TaxID=28072 RepID=UPI000A02AC26